MTTVTISRELLEQWEADAQRQGNRFIANSIRAALNAQPAQLGSCTGKDPLCPCQDGDACHYKDAGDSKAWPVPAQPEQGELQPFMVRVQGEFDHELEAISINGMMTVMTTEGAIYITREQAAKFFGFTQQSSQPESRTRADGMSDSKTERQLRRMLCIQRHGVGAYMDDGEASWGGGDNHRPIDYMRETPEAIEQAWREAGLRQIAASAAQPAQTKDLRITQIEEAINAGQKQRTRENNKSVAQIPWTHTVGVGQDVRIRADEHNEHRTGESNVDGANHQLDSVSTGVQSSIEVCSSNVTHSQSSQPEPTLQVPDGMIEVPAHEANNYSRILTLLAMEEEGDPVAEVERLIAAPQAAQSKQVPLTDDQFQAIKDSLRRQEGWDGDSWDLALKERIETAHGIGAAPQAAQPQDQLQKLTETTEKHGLYASDFAQPQASETKNVYGEPKNYTYKAYGWPFKNEEPQAPEIDCLQCNHRWHNYTEGEDKCDEQCTNGDKFVKLEPVKLYRSGV